LESVRTIDYEPLVENLLQVFSVGDGGVRRLDEYLELVSVAIERFLFDITSSLA
jgi:hypothetical protein